MLNHIELKQQVNHFLVFLNISEKMPVSHKISRFFIEAGTEKREVLHDNGAIHMFSDGRLKQCLETGRFVNHNRIVKFDGKVITDINHSAYMDKRPEENDMKIYAKGDKINRSRSRSGSSSSGSRSSNNNNNNNNG